MLLRLRNHRLLPRLIHLSAIVLEIVKLEWVHSREVGVVIVRLHLDHSLELVRIVKNIWGLLLRLHRVVLHLGLHPKRLLSWCLELLLLHH